MSKRVKLLASCLLGQYKIEENELQFEEEIVCLSKRLQRENVDHVIIKDNDLGVSIMLKDDAPSILLYNKINKEWDYFSQYIDNTDEEPQNYAQYVIPDNLDIMKFVKVILKTNKDENG